MEKVKTPPKDKNIDILSKYREEQFEETLVIDDPEISPSKFQTLCEYIKDPKGKFKHVIIRQARVASTHSPKVTQNELYIRLKNSPIESLVLWPHIDDNVQAKLVCDILKHNKN